MSEREKNPTYLEHKTQRISSIEDVEEFLYSELSNAPKTLFREGEGFSRSRYFMRELGDPQEEFKTIHVAGTSGKGSSVYYISNILITHGFGVGTHVSPHIYDLRERSMLDMNYPDDGLYLKSINGMLPAIEKMSTEDTGRPTYFEVTVGNAFNIFAHKGVDYAVVETGLGGRYDSTNTIARSDKLAVITKIGLDHTDVLGSTYELIAAQKAGIMQEGGDVLAVNGRADVTEVFERIAKDRRSNLDILHPSEYAQNIQVGPDGISFDYDDGELKIKSCKISTIALYQVENACLAISSIGFLAKRDGFSLDKNKIREGLDRTIIPGRCEVRQIDGKTVILDGAHNPQKLKGLINSIKYLNLPSKPVWLMAMKRDKDIKSALSQITDFSDKVIFSEFFRNSDNEHLRDYAIDANVLSGFIPGSIALADQKRAFKKALDMTDEQQLLIISGSIYFLSEIRHLLGNVK